MFRINEGICNEAYQNTKSNKVRNTLYHWTIIINSFNRGMDLIIPIENYLDNDYCYFDCNIYDSINTEKIVQVKLSHFTIQYKILISI